MCECGCATGDTVYRLPIDIESCYAIRLRQGCRNCGGGPIVIVQRIDGASLEWNELQEAPLLPFANVYDWAEAAIACGPSPDEFKEFAVKAMVDSGDEEIDEDLADIVADDVWDAGLGKPPRLIEYKQN